MTKYLPVALALVVGAALGAAGTWAVQDAAEAPTETTDWWEAWEGAYQDQAQPPCLDVPSTHPSMAPPSPDGEAYSTDLDGRVTWVNPCVVTSGWRMEPIQWTSPDDLVTCSYNGASEWLCGQP